ncbi:MAG: LytTR family DNA-binding domain-containing protein [Lachnospiraceae bacterium]|nr:LytTR family DNA-binding domain-containing protein [Lachnospiraceae bacterium]
MLRLVIVEDDPKEQEILKGYIERYFAETESCEVSVFSDGTELLARYPSEPDILFLDIAMKQSNGVAVAKEVRKRDSRVLILFVTEMAQYALEGYKVNACDFLVKPVYYTSFCNSMKRAMAVLKRRMPDMIEVHYDKTSRYLDVATIYYIETSNKKTLFHTQSGDFFASDTMKMLEEKLESHGILRCHQAFLVNVRFIESVYRQEVLVHGIAIPISRQKREDFLQKFVSYMGGNL